ncbi:MAG: alpha/beta fold hydrolase [Pseudonocardiaceae bacterium]
MARRVRTYPGRTASGDPLRPPRYGSINLGLRHRPLPGDPAGRRCDHDPDPGLLQLWEHFTDPRSREEELDWRVEHWRILAGSVLPFHAEEFRRLEERIIDHAGRHDNPAAHARAPATGLNRAAELAHVRTPTLVIEAPEDPINPPPHARHLTQLIPTARLVTVPGMGRALSATVVEPICRTILTHTAGY